MKTILIACLFVGLLAAQAGTAPRNQPDRLGPDIETEVTRTLDDYMSAWNRKDMAAWERTFHFPHYRLASGKMSVLDRPGLQDASKVWASAGSDWSDRSASGPRRLMRDDEAAAKVSRIALRAGSAMPSSSRAADIFRSQASRSEPPMEKRACASRRPGRPLWCE